MRSGCLALLLFMASIGFIPPGCDRGASSPDGAIQDDGDFPGDEVLDGGDSATGDPDDGNDAGDEADAGDEGDGDEGGDSGTDPLVDCENIFQTPGGTYFYEDNPTYQDSLDDTGSWTFSPPEDQGMDGTLLSAAVSELEGVSYLWSFLVIRNDTIVLERYFNGCEANHSNNVHSASKSILSALTGIAIEQQLIDGVDQPVYEIFPEYFAGGHDPVKETITIRHLLTMSAGLAWEENQTENQIEQQTDWVQAILDLPLDDQPGASFNYCTGQSHVLSAVITRTTGMSTCEFAHRHLLGHLGVTAEHWGRDPQSVFSGGCNLYLTARELAKFGLLYLHQGSWNDLQIVPRQWVTESLTAKIDAGWDYGYYWWLTEFAGHQVSVAWGYGGQLVYLIPDLNLVVVFTTRTRGYYQEFDGQNIIRQYVIPSADG